QTPGARGATHAVSRPLTRSSSPSQIERHRVSLPSPARRRCGISIYHINHFSQSGLAVGVLDPRDGNSIAAAETTLRVEMTTATKSEPTNAAPQVARRLSVLASGNV